MRLSVWLKAARLRTLPLAFSCILAGNLLAVKESRFSLVVFALALLTTLLLQVLANYANDYGDFMNGADVKGNKRSDRMLASGNLSPSQMKKALLLLSLLSFGSGFALLLVALQDAQLQDFIFFLFLGLLSIAAAYFYTAGKRPYGYRALGDFSVMLFFGPVGVAGSYYLQTLAFDATILLPSLTMGFWAVAVLNLNNMRDRINDANAGKMTVAVYLGAQGAMSYHTALTVSIMLAMGCFCFLNATSLGQYCVLIPGIINLGLLLRLWKVNQPAAFDPYLKPTALLALLNGALMAIL